MEVNLTNFKSSFTLIDGFEAITSRPSLLPKWFFWAYISVIVLGGFISNGLLAGYLARRRIYPVVFQLCLTDITTLLFIAPYEILVLLNPAGEWPFPSVFCPIFSGLEVLLGTATIYLLIVFNFSSVVGNNETSLKVPLLTLWLLSISLSIPEFIFAELINTRQQYNICSIPKRAALLIGVFRLSLPVFLLFVSVIVVLTVWYKSEDPSGYFCLPLVLSIAYIAISVQRNVFGVLYALYSPLSSTEVYRTPPLADVIHNPIGTLSLAMIHYTLSAVRPLFTWSFNSNLNNVSDTNDTNNVV